MCAYVCVCVCERMRVGIGVHISVRVYARARACVCVCVCLAVVFVRVSVRVSVLCTNEGFHALRFAVVWIGGQTPDATRVPPCIYAFGVFSHIRRW